MIQNGATATAVASVTKRAAKEAVHRKHHKVSKRSLSMQTVRRARLAHKMQSRKVKMERNRLPKAKADQPSRSAAARIKTSQTTALKTNLSDVRINLTLLLLLSIWLGACADESVVFEQNVEIADARWAVTEKAVLSVEVKDTVSQHNFLINVRNTEEYPYRNLYVFLKTTFPNGKTSRDTIGLYLADASGRWLGSGSGYLNSGRYPTNRVMYAYNKSFPLSGTYVFEIEQAMRVDTLLGIRNIGLRIEKMQNHK